MARRKRPDSGLSGSVIVDKPTGMTSHDVVARARRAFGTRKVGHAGTLDPDATGVLVLGVGRGTKLLTFISGLDKRYVGEVVFGTETSTLDAAGEVTATHTMPALDDAAVQAALPALTGDIEQIPPMVSAIKIDGKRLHELAREGKEVDRPPRPVTIHAFSAAPTDDPMVWSIDVHCSSGTYIRTLAADLGHLLGGGAHLRALRRTSVGPWALDLARPLEDDGSLDPDALGGLATLVTHLPSAVIGPDEAIAVSHGKRLTGLPAAPHLAVFDEAGALLAIYDSDGASARPVVVLQAA